MGHKFSDIALNHVRSHNMDMDISLIKDDEIEEAADLMASCFSPSYHSIFFLKKEHTVVSREDGRITGGCNADVFTIPGGKKIGYIGWLYTQKEARGKGTASALKEEMFSHLEKEGCDEILLLIEGDNPSSFKLFCTDMRIMGLFSQIRTFGIGMVKVWKRMSHFFDFGYFLWHRGKGRSIKKESIADWLYLAFFSIASTLIFAFRTKAPILESLCITLILSLGRCLVMKLVLGWRYSILINWDTSLLYSLISALALPFFLPPIAGVYVKGGNWKMGEKRLILAAAGGAAIAVEAVLATISGRPDLTIPLLLMDALLPFYPFSGFNASRIKRQIEAMGKK